MSKNQTKGPYTGEPEKAEIRKLPGEPINSKPIAPGGNNIKQEEIKLNTQPNGSPMMTKKTQNNEEYEDRDMVMENNSGDLQNTVQNRDDLRVVAAKLKTQNERLKQQLKELSIRLAETFEKVRTKKSAPSKSVETSKQEDPMKRELDDANRELQMYKKELQSIRGRMEVTQSEVRIQTLENKVKDKDRQIEQLISENSSLEKARRDQERDLDDFHNIYNYNQKLKNYDDESKKLRLKIREMHEIMRQDEKDFKKQQERLCAVEERYREVCDNLGISASLNITKADESNKMKAFFTPKTVLKKRADKEANLIQGNKYFGYEYDEEDEEDARLPLTEQSIVKLRSDCDGMQDELKASERSFKAEVDKLTAQFKESDAEKKSLEERLREKDKELNILQHRVSEFKRITKTNLPGAKMSSPDTRIPISN